MFLFSLACLLMLSVQEGVATLRHDVGLRYVNLNDVIFTAGLLWVTECSSMTECAVACMTDDQCISFSLSPPDDHGRRPCRGHSLLVEDLGSEMKSEGTRLYSLTNRAFVNRPAVTTEGPWHERSCDSDSDCPRTNSECFAGSCLCTPGYYYSVGSDTCVSTCSDSDLGQWMVEYPMYYISGFNSNSLTTSFPNCVTLCLGDSTCHSIDFRYSTNRCSTSVYTPLDKPSAWTASTESEKLFYYQRVCA